MKSKSYVFQCLMILNIVLTFSCNSSKNLVKSDSYSVFSQKLGVKLNGDENPELLEELIGWKGVPYKYGGSTKSGTDCSGFVASVYKKVYGKQLNRTSVDMADNVRFVSKKELKAGDILFFKINSRKISHVGIYIADNKFMHASTKNGVVVSDLGQKYYAESFYKGGRVRDR